MRPKDETLAIVQRRQHGAFTRDQAMSAGYSTSTLSRRVADGRFIRLYPRVYADSSARRTPDQRSVAAWLSCGEPSAVSHRSAALLLKLDVGVPDVPEVTVPSPRAPRARGIRVYRSLRLGSVDTALVGSVRVTSPVRTITDLASVLDEIELEVVLDELWRKRMVRPNDLLEYLRDPWCSKRPGTSVLREMARARLASTANASALETLFFGILRRAKLPLPTTNHLVRTAAGPRYLDYAYPDHRVAIELDSVGWHSGRHALDSDTARQNAIEAGGYTMRRFTRTHCRTDPWGVIATVAAAIGVVPSRWRRGRLP